MIDGSLAPSTSVPPPLPPAPPPAETSDRELLDRFHRLRDQTAFEALLRRHGPMVLGVCRRVLFHVHDAEDAFQATFMILVRKAGGLRDPALLANYLYGVAFRVARKLRTRIARQAQNERRATSMPAEEPKLDLDRQELRSLLEGELEALPAKYRAPLVLCYLEGLTNEEAARRLGWPVGSISYRLARGRELLRQRLGRREKTLQAEMLGSLLVLQFGPEPLSESLFRQTVHAALDQAGNLSVVAGGRARRLLKAVAPDIRSAIVGILLIVLTLGLVTGVVAHGLHDGQGSATASGSGDSDAPPCHCCH